MGRFSKARACILAAAVAFGLVLAGCGGDGDNAGDPDGSASPTIGSAGGEVSLADGARVVVPAGAFTQDVTLRIAKDSSGAPALPAALKTAGSVYAITPHGGAFEQPVEVRLPLPTTTPGVNESWGMASAEPGGDWVVLGDTEVRDGMLVTRVRRFSYFTAVAIAYPALPSLSTPWTVTSLTVLCDGQPCNLPATPTRLDFDVTSNKGQLPAACTQGATLVPLIYIPLGFNIPGDATPLGTQATTRASMNVIPPMSWWSTAFYLRCTVDGAEVWKQLYYGPDIRFDGNAVYATPRLLSVVQMPVEVQVAKGSAADIRAVFTGGGAQVVPPVYARVAPTVTTPSARDQAMTTWYLSRDQGAHWTAVGESFQVDADPVPFAALADPLLPPWLYWSHTIGFGPAQAADDGSLVRVQSCYTKPGTSVPECVTGPATRITVLQDASVPAFTQQPRSMIVQPGQTASPSVVASGLPAPTLQWQTRPAGAADWADVAPGGTGSSYTTPALALADDGVQYRVVATNAAGSTASDVVTVFVRGDLVAPAIGTQPQPVTVAAGSEALFAVNATGTEALSYQWFKGSSPVAGANAPQLKLANVTTGDAGSYSVRVSNAAGSVTSNAAALTVTAVAPPATAPLIVTQPASASVAAGSTATFAVGVTGSAPLTFQWRKDGFDIAGANAAAYTLPAAAEGDAGDYTVRVSNSAGSVVSQVGSLTVMPAGGPLVAPSFSTQPSGVVVAPGMGFTLAAVAQGSGPLAYAWRRPGSATVLGTDAVLQVTSAGAGDAGGYQLTVTSLADASLPPALSDVVQVVLLGAPAIATPPQARSAVEGSTATFTVAATGDALRYLWLRNGVPVAGAESASLTTPVLTLADNGALYSVVVYNGAGAVLSAAATLSVTAAPPPALADLSAWRGKVAAGDRHSCAIRADNTLACWGYGGNGQVGTTGSFFDVPIPVVLSGTVHAVAAGANTSCAIHDVDRRLTCMGSIVGSSTPQRVSIGFTPVTGVASVAVGAFHLCFVAADARVACLGDNSTAQLGQLDTAGYTGPQWVFGAAGLLFGARAVSAGSFHTCALLSDSSVACWGNVNQEFDPSNNRVLTTRATTVAGTLGTVQVAAAQQHTCLMQGDGSVRCWGANDRAQLGRGATGAYEPNPGPVSGLTDAVALAAGGAQTCAVRNDRTLACWGLGSMGDGSAPVQAAFPRAAGNGLADIAGLAVGATQVLALDRARSLWSWGANGDFQLGRSGGVAFPGAVTGGAVFWAP